MKDKTLEQAISKYDNPLHRIWLLFLMNIPVPFLNLKKPKSIRYKFFSWQFGESYVHGAWIIARQAINSEDGVE